MILGEAFHRRNILAIAQRLERQQKHAILLFDSSNIYYATGLRFLDTDRPLAACVWADGSLALFVPQLEADHLGSSWVRDIRWYAEYPAEEHPARWMVREAGTPLLIDTVDARTWHDIQEESTDATLSNLVHDLRLVKSPAEIELLQQAADFADMALERAFARLTSGVAERDVRDEIVQLTKRELAEEFGGTYDDADPQVSGRIVSGLHAAFPYAPASLRQLARGDVVVVEFTVSIGGYHAQAGSSFFVGDPLRDIVNAVTCAMKAQAEVRAMLKPDATGDAAYQEARKALERSGFGNAIRHRAGQGTGLDQIEAPWLARGSTQRLQPGMVVVNQPGLYLPGRTGVRHSETVLIEPGGPRILNPRIQRWDDPESRLKEF